MPIELSQAVPWGRNLDEYRRMFSLTDPDLDLRILDVAAGPSSFNAELHAQGHANITSVDPLYEHPACAIRQRVHETYGTIVEGCRRDAHRFVWTDSIPDPDALGAHRIASMNAFLADYDVGKSQGRYLPQALPTLFFPDQSFDLALCSHFLFLYTTQLSLDFHLASIKELCRVAREIRLFPLLDMASQPSSHVTPVRNFVTCSGCTSEIVQVDYEFLKGAHAMLVIRSDSIPHSRRAPSHDR